MGSVVIVEMHEPDRIFRLTDIGWHSAIFPTHVKPATLAAASHVTLPSPAVHMTLIVRNALRCFQPPPGSYVRVTAHDYVLAPVVAKLRVTGVAAR